MALWVKKKKNGEKNINLSPHEGKSGQELPGRTWKQEQKQRPWRNAACWLVPHGLLSLHSQKVQDFLPRGSAAHHRLGPHISTINKENVPTYLPLAQSDRNISSAEVLFSQITLVWFFVFVFLIPRKSSFSKCMENHRQWEMLRDNQMNERDCSMRLVDTQQRDTAVVESLD